MREYINRQLAMNALGERPMVWTSDDDYALGERNQYDIDRLAIETVPSADAVEVVRCKYCKHADEYYHCDYSAVWNSKNDYCCHGERKDG